MGAFASNYTFIALMINKKVKNGRIITLYSVSINIHFYK